MYGQAAGAASQRLVDLAWRRKATHRWSGPALSGCRSRDLRVVFTNRLPVGSAGIRAVCGPTHESALRRATVFMMIAVIGPSGAQALLVAR
jgi:hypothetical protein